MLAALVVWGCGEAVAQGKAGGTWQEWVKAFPKVPRAFTIGCPSELLANESGLTSTKCPVQGGQVGYFLDKESPVMLVVGDVGPATFRDEPSCRSTFEAVLPGLKKAQRQVDEQGTKLYWQAKAVSYQLLFVKDSECLLLACKPGARRYPFHLENPCLPPKTP
ncbi:MAG TPA: hypothetical protein VGB96_09185 [Archangium sp.]